VERGGGLGGAVRSWLCACATTTTLKNTNN
jgi:hypothetical protein